MNVEEAVTIMWLNRTLAKGINGLARIWTKFCGTLNRSPTSSAVHQGLIREPQMTGTAHRTHNRARGI